MMVPGQHPFAGEGDLRAVRYTDEPGQSHNDRHLDRIRGRMENFVPGLDHDCFLGEHEHQRTPL
ncbi:hypothetical protein BL254_10260 [Protofrankia sp. BMG5.30]|nr:hypothetical protein BL254_10260 [Protofrankia sp. BMG5.30]